MTTQHNPGRPRFPDLIDNAPLYPAISSRMGCILALAFPLAIYKSSSLSSPKEIPFVTKLSQTMVSFIDPATVTAAPVPVSDPTFGITFGC